MPSEDDTAKDGQSRVESSTLLWNGHTYLGEYLATNTSGIAYTRSESDEEESDSYIGGCTVSAATVLPCTQVLPVYECRGLSESVHAES